MRKKKTTNEYVDNAKLYLEMVRYKKAIEDAEKEGKERPRIPEYVGECIWKIANNLSLNFNFINYSFREEMISDGIENCVLYIHNFDPEKSNSPFAYITQIVWYAFIRRIQKEKKQQYIKAKNLQMLSIQDSLNEVSSIQRMAPNDAMNILITDFEKSEMKKKESKPPKGLEKFVEEEDE